MAQDNYIVIKNTEAAITNMLKSPNSVGTSTLQSEINSINNKIGKEQLETSSSTIIGAINEIKNSGGGSGGGSVSVVDNLNSYSSYSALSANQGRILNVKSQELSNQIGNLTNLKTEVKTNVVNAINEIVNSGGSGDLSEVNNRLSTLEEAVFPFKINSFSLGAATTQLFGSQINSPSFSFSFSETPKSITLKVGENTEESISATAKTYTSNNSIISPVFDTNSTSKSIECKLTAISSKGSTVTKTISVVFTFYVYSYAGTETYEESKIKGILKSSKKGTYNVTGDSTNTYIWMGFPVSYGEPTFNIGGFEGGFILGASTNIDVNGISIPYKFYRSNTPQASASKSTEITVS